VPKSLYYYIKALGKILLTFWRYPIRKPFLSIL
jgi:hypothetical protein